MLLLIDKIFDKNEIFISRNDLLDIRKQKDKKKQKNKLCH